jgi:putative oxidoreductase
MKLLFNSGEHTNAKPIMLLLLRLSAGGFMLYGHGLRKWDKLMGGGEISFADPFGIGPQATLGLVVFAEVLCAVLLILGLFTRWALIPLAFTMLVAAFYIKSGKPFGDREMALLYLLLFAVSYVFGPGKYSLDAYLEKRKG